MRTKLRTIVTVIHYRMQVGFQRILQKNKERALPSSTGENEKENLRLEKQIVVL